MMCKKHVIFNYAEKLETDSTQFIIVVTSLSLSLWIPCTDMHYTLMP